MPGIPRIPGGIIPLGGPTIKSTSNTVSVLLNAMKHIHNKRTSTALK